MTDQRYLYSPVDIDGPDEDGIVTVTRRGAVYLAVWQKEPDEGLPAGECCWREEGELKGPGLRWYIRADEDLPIPYHQAWAALGEAKVGEVEALVRPKRRLGRKK